MEKIKKIIRNATDSEKARIWCELNVCEWPAVLGPTPSEFLSEDRDIRHKFLWALMEEAQVTGIKECLREWNKDRMPGKKFDEWWSKRDRLQ